MELEIRVDQHTLDNLEERGTSEEEVRLVIRTGTVTPARFGRWMAKRVLTEGYEHNGTRYRHKEISVVYAIDRGMVVTVTVKTRFGFWESEI